MSAAPVFDIAFIGSGIACSMTLLELAEKLTCTESGRFRPARPRIAVVEKDEQFWCGIPYGPRTSVRSLAIQKLDEFVKEPEKSAYLNWLERNKSRWLTSFRERGGDAAKRWIRDNREAVAANRWGELYLPRYVFGLFLAEQVDAVITELSERGLADVAAIHAEAVSARSAYGRTVIGLRPAGDGPAEIEAARVVVAIGSPPTKTILSAESNRQDGPAFAYLNDLYLPSQEVNLRGLRRSLERIAPRENRNVLIVGSNATSLEVLYLIRHDPGIREHLASITVISRSGLLPYQICEQPQEFEFPCLNALLRTDATTAAGLMAAIRSDLELATQRSLNIADLYDDLGVLLWQVLGDMEVAEQEEFYCVHGMDFTKLVRRAGRDCRGAAEELVADGTLTMLAGEVLEVRGCASGEPLATVRYQTADAIHTHPDSFAAVINCGGFEDLDGCSSPFLASAMRNGLGRPNRTNRGLAVNDDFEASPNFYVIGPLIGGNFTPRIRFWHVESAPRIRSLAKSLATTLFAALPPAANASGNSYVHRTGSHHDALVPAVTESTVVE